MLIDMHTHPIFYDLICGDQKELEFRKDIFGIWKQSPQSFEEVFVEMDYCGINKAVLLALDLTTQTGGHVVSNEQVTQIVAAYPDRFFGFASIDPYRVDAVDVLSYAFNTLKLSGLKLHPSKQRFFPSDKLLEPIYQTCEKYNKPILFHAGMTWEPNAPAKYSHPLEFEEVFIAHPQLRCCLAHFAWPWIREVVMLMLKYPHVYTDTSVLALDSPEESMQRLFMIDMGPMWFERSFSRQVMFASNGPRFRAFKLKRALDTIPMRDYARENLYGGNALRFLDGGDR
jgi:predicted TIM-barrel fold metal-dependent hydrolase